MRPYDWTSSDDSEADDQAAAPGAPLVDRHAQQSILHRLWGQQPAGSSELRLQREMLTAITTAGTGPLRATANIAVRRAAADRQSQVSSPQNAVAVGQIPGAEAAPSAASTPSVVSDVTATTHNNALSLPLEAGTSALLAYVSRHARVAAASAMAAGSRI